jgi:hypothetical protein
MLAVCKCKGPIFILHQPEKCTSPFSSRSWSMPVRSTDCKLLWFLIAKFNKLQAAQPQVSRSESPAINTCHIVIVIVSTFIGGLTWVDAIWRCEPVAPRLVPQWEKRAWNIVWWQLAKPLQGLQDSAILMVPKASARPPQCAVKDRAALEDSITNLMSSLREPLSHLAT